jgi:putative endonuclease
MSRKYGLAGEDQAAFYLEAMNWSILERNFHSKLGEIDIIAKTPGNVLVFCEVKTYTSKSWVSPIAAITKSKQRKLYKTAQYYLMRYPHKDTEMRFDALIVNAEDIEHYENIMQLSA